MSLTVSHVAHRYRVNVGDILTLRTRVKISQDWPAGTPLKLVINLKLTTEPYGETLTWPQVLTLAPVKDPPGFSLDGPYGKPTGLELCWTRQVAESAGAGSVFDFEIQVLISASFGMEIEQFLRKDDRLRQRLDREREWLIHTSAKVGEVEDHTCVAVQVMSRYALNLPSIYRDWDNDLLGRWLMVCDSQWGRASLILDHLDSYVDPLLAPPSLLAWLMSWGGLMEDIRWPEKHRRKLIGALLGLQRKRGTPEALRKHIELYTGCLDTVDIKEPRISNVQLTAATKLGPTLVLGATDKAHVFEVTASACYKDKDDSDYNTHLSVIRKIIDFHTPAHAQLLDDGLHLEKYQLEQKQ